MRAYRWHCVQRDEPADIVAASTRDACMLDQGLGFVRNESARQLRAGRSRMIGLIVLDVANPFFTDVARGVEDEVSKSGLAVILCNSDDQLPRENGYLDLLEENRVQGILITPVADDRHRLAQLQARGTPVILVDSRSRPAGSARSRSTMCSAAILRDSPDRDGHERIAFAGGRSACARSPTAARALAGPGQGRRGPAELMIFETPALNVAAGKAAAAPSRTRPRRTGRRRSSAPTTWSRSACCRR